jgi:hypothetical protein
MSSVETRKGTSHTTPNSIRDRVIGRRKIQATQIQRDQTLTFDAKKGDWLVTDDLGNRYVARSVPPPANFERDARVEQIRREVLQVGFAAIELHEHLAMLLARSPNPSPPSPIPVAPSSPPPGANGVRTPPPEVRA